MDRFALDADSILKETLYMNLKGFYNSQFQFADGMDRHGIGRVQLLKTGTFMHPKAPNGKFEINSGHLHSFKNNFDTNVRNLDKGELAADYEHKHEGESSGWIKSLELEDDGKSLWAVVDWTSRAEKKILDREYRFISADVDFEYIDNETGKNHGPTLLGLGLVNRPHIKGMRAIFTEQYSDDNKGAQMELEKVLEMLQSMMARLDKIEAGMGSKMEAEEKKEKEVMKKENVELKAELAETAAKLNTASEAIKKHDSEKAEIQKEAKFSELMTEGKILPTQKEAFMKMDLTLAEEFFSNAKVLNLNENGNGKEKKTETTTDDEGDAIHAKAVKLMESDKSLKLGEAYSKVMSEDKELGTKYSKKNSL